MSRVKKPCPACKTTDYYREDADSICCKCLRILQHAKEQMERDAKIDKTEVFVSTCERSYALPNWYHLSEQSRPSTTTNDKMQKAFFKLISGQVIRDIPGNVHVENEDLLCVPPEQKGHRREWQRRVVMSKATAESINELDTAIREALVEVAEGAYEKGQSLLLGIASGDVSMSDLNKATIGKNR